MNAPSQIAKTLEQPPTETGRVMKRPTVMHVRVVTGAGGGPDKTILNSPRFLEPRGFDCVCTFLRPPDDASFNALRTRASAWDARIVEVDDRGPWSVGLVARLAALCDELSIDVWHAHDYKTNLLGLLVKRRRPMTLITTCHGWVERTWRTTIYHQVDRLTLRRYDHVVAVSADIATRCREFGVRDDKLSLVENAIDIEQYSRSRSPEEAKAALGWPQGRTLVGAVGRLSAEKGFDVLLRALAQLVADGLDVGVVIAGDGAERASLERLAAELDLVERVRFAGFQANLIPLYEAMDVYALSSRREGLPNVLLEAMSLETPVVATNIAGIPQLIQHGANGLLVQADDAASLASALKQLASDAEMRRSLGSAGRDVISQRYSFDRRMDKIAHIYEQALRGD